MDRLTSLLLFVFFVCSCASASKRPLESSYKGCKMTAEADRQLSLDACASAAAAGISICTPPGPLGTGAIVCESSANGVKLGEMSTDPDWLEQNGMATQAISAPIVMPDGEIAAVVACEINRRH